MQVQSVKPERDHYELGSVAKATNEAEITGHINLTQDARKPSGSAYVSVKMRIGSSKLLVDADICIDTGADFTLCDSAFLKTHFGETDALKHLYFPSKIPKLRSASGHELPMLGKVDIDMMLGDYEMKLQVLVHEGDIGMFLLGSDSFYDKLVYDRGRFLAFADDKYPPVPIKYELMKHLVKAVSQCRVAPRSSALIQVKVTDNTQFTGKEVILYPIETGETNGDGRCCTHHEMAQSKNPVRNSVSTIDSSGNAYVLVENSTDDILNISADAEIASVELITEDDSLNEGRINFIIDQDKKSSISPDGKWPISALKGELAERLPSNIVVQWDKLYKSVSGDKLNADDPQSIHGVNYVHDKQERKDLLDGTGEGFPTPPAADSIHSDQDLDEDPEGWLNSVEHSHLSESDWIKLREVLVRNKEAFSKSKTEIGCCNYFKVDLPLKPGAGYLYNKPRPLPHKHREMAAETISELLAKGVIRPSRSPHATNIVCVKKKTMNGVISHRICVDLRQVNENSIPNRFPNYWVEDAMSKIQGAAFRTAMDFKDAFHMLVLTEESIPVTAFYFNNVLFEYVRVPFGHVCAMNAFCCLMALLCIGYDPASYYADDLMITTKTDVHKNQDQLFDQHLEHVEGMLQRIIDAGLKLVAHKCQWGYDANKPMEWLGFTMENNLLKPQESKVKAMKEFPTPTTSKQVISFIATASFYRRFIKGFAKIVQPMFNVAYAEHFKWTQDAQDAFEEVKDIMCSDLVLRLPRQGEPFQIYSDASAGALGVVLCQIDPVDKKSHPCAYGSRKFNAGELKLSIPCKELLAIVYGLNLWSYYICGNPIQVFSDCRAWTFLKMQSGVSGKVSRLALLVSEYDISISFLKGTLNKAADGLSRAHDDGLTKYDDLITARHPALELLQAPELPEGEVLKLSDYLVKCDDYLTDHWPKVLKQYEEKKLSLGEDPDLENLNQKLNQAQQKLNNLEKDALKEAEYVNQVIHEAAILHFDRNNTANWNQKLRKDRIYPFQVNEDEISNGYSSEGEIELVSIGDSEQTNSEEIESEVDEVRTTDSSFKAAVYNIRMVAINESVFSIPAFIELQSKDEFCQRKIDLIKAKDNRTKSSGYFMKRGILMRQMQTKDMQNYYVICVPQALVKPLMESSHRSLLSGHFGGERYSLNMARKYYWPKMKDDIIDFHRSCLPCQYNDKYPVKYSSGYVIRPRWPMHVVHCDLIVGLPKALDGSYAILLLYDGFSRFTFGIPLTSEKADYVVKKLMSHFVAAFGLPWALHSDNGRNVDGSLIRHLALMLGVLKTSTPPHTPNANPTETMCGAVSMLLRKALNGSDKRYWSLCLPFILNALNSTVHTATGYTPNSLFFGRYQERDPVPLVPFDAPAANVNEYFQKMRRFQELSFQIVRSRNERKLLANKEKWDETARIHPFKEGDFVLVKNNNPASGPGKMKLRSKYVGPFRVIKAYTSSLVVVPWTEVDRLEEYYKDPNLFRYIHRGDIKPFHTRQVAVKHCKPFKGNIKTEQIIDPIMLTRFLDMLGVDSSEDIISEIDHDKSSTKASSSSNDSDDSNPRPPGPEGWREPDANEDGDHRQRRRWLLGRSPPPGHHRHSESSDSGPDDNYPAGGGAPADQGMGQDEGPGPDPNEEADVGPELGRNPEEIPPQRQDHRVIGQGLARRRNSFENLFANVRMSDVDRAVLRHRARQEAEDHVVNNQARYYQRMRELEVLIESPNANVRGRAERELRETTDQLKRDMGIGDPETEDVDFDPDQGDSEAASTTDFRSARTHASTQGSLAGARAHMDDPNLEWDYDHEQTLTGMSPPTQEININTPGMRINIRPSNLGSNIPPPRNPEASPRRMPRGRQLSDVQDWVSTTSPLIREDLGNQPPQPEAESPGYRTRSGRLVKTPPKLADDIIRSRVREDRELAKAMELSRLQAEADQMSRRSSRVLRTPPQMGRPSDLPKQPQAAGESSRGTTTSARPKAPPQPAASSSKTAPSTSKGVPPTSSRGRSKINPSAKPMGTRQSSAKPRSQERSEGFNPQADVTDPFAPRSSVTRTPPGSTR